MLDGESLLLTDGTWISFPRLLTWHRRDGRGALALEGPGPLDPWLFDSWAAAMAQLETWPASMGIAVVKVR